MPFWIDVDVIPEIARPEAVDRVLAEALSLRDRLRAAQEELAAAQADLERQEQADVAQAAERIRSGEAPGAIPAAIAKSRQKVELAKRNANALALASEAAQHDLAETMTTNADAWLATLDEETERARKRGRAAIEQLEVATHEIGDAASATSWLRSGIDDGRFDRQPRAMLVGSVATSSKRRTANSEPLAAREILDYCRELLVEPSQPAARAATTLA
jgi:hypothetical protein